MSYHNRYSPLDRALHRIVFATAASQVGVASLEEKIYRRELESITADRPVFITSLPRSGTTMLLNITSEIPEFAVHRYRDMPFVLSPMIGRSLLAKFRTQDAPIERAHGDGMSISQDSPEAFEEMAWKVFWPSHYKADRILTWRRCDDDEFVDFLRSHMRKIIALRRADTARSPSRYISKNNLNIARLTSLSNAFSGATIIVPFREPLQHAQSLLNQHLRFLQLHEEDPFSKQYMAGIGHFDFGANLKPIDFDGWIDRSEYRDATTLGFWLEYWRAAFQHVLEHQAAHIKLLCYEWFCNCTDIGLPKLAEFLELPDAGPLMHHASDIGIRTMRDVDCAGVDGALVTDVREIYRALQTAAGGQNYDVL